MHNIPLYMKHPNCKRWLLWKSIPSQNGKNKKVPFYTNGKARNGELDTSEDYSQLVSFDEAYNVLNKTDNYTGLGFALGPDGNGGYWQGIDLDDIKDNEFIKNLILPGYVEQSPSQNGLHAIGYGEKFETLGSNDSGIEAYCAKRFFTVTGNAENHTPTETIADLSSFVKTTLQPLHLTKETIYLKNEIHEITVSDDVIKDIETALQFIPADPYDDWIAVGQALKELGVIGFSLWAMWSAKSEKFQPDDLERWETFKGDRTGYKAIFKRAERNGWLNPCKYPDPATIFGTTLNTENIIRATNWKQVSINDVFTNIPQPPTFIIESLIPEKVLTLISANGGAGKSMLALQAAVCISMGMPFLKKAVAKNNVLFFSAEDKESTIRHRIKLICEHLNVDPLQLAEKLIILDSTNNPILFQETTSQGVKRGVVTKEYIHLKEFIRLNNIEMTIIDNSSETYDANENERTRVREFIRELVRLHENGMSVLLIAHVDKQTARGMSSNEGYSGSTAWNNSARSRLTLKIEENYLLLEQQKLNLGIKSEPIYLKWSNNGILVEIDKLSLPNYEGLVLRLLHDQYQKGIFASIHKNTEKNIFLTLRKHTDFPIGLTRKDLDKIIDKAVSENKIIIEEYRNGDRKLQERYKVALSVTTDLAQTCST